MFEGLIINSINNVLNFTQEKALYLSQNSLFIKHIDGLIFASILAVLGLSIFMPSDALGYVALITLFLTVIKLFVKKGEKIEGNLFELLLLVYFIFVVISLSGSTLFHLSLKGFLKTFVYLGFYFSAVQYFKNNLSKIPFAIGLIALCAGIEGFVGIFQNFGQVGEIATWQDVTNINPEDVMTRVYGTLQPFNPNLFGGYLVAVLPCLFGFSAMRFYEKHYKLGIFFLVLALVSSYALILSGSRGAYLGFLAIIVGIFAFLAKFIWSDLEKNREFFKKIYVSLAAFAAALVAFAVVFISSVRTRVLSIFAMRADSSTSFRLNVYHSALEMIKDNWLFGIGVGNQNFREIYGLYMKTGFDALSCYSVFLEVAVESGIFALIAFLGFLGVFAKQTFKFITQNSDFKLCLIVSISLISVFAVMVHGLVDTVFFRPQIQFVFWTLTACASSVLRKAETI
ncbi:MAG TPA: O-antigen ligase family protein [Candidatus Gastranaerophilaceae bacterium]|nr:O-antigen ligase family protein [Candidatus Gastranaerophilaceae bacterium]HPT41131.1 O-antigen ligase family protein [Candidatus Gastranaerophilaceae bacterium]